MQKLTLIRGLPGSGKSTLAKLRRDQVHVETDMYFETENGYEFDASKLKEAHEWCQKKVDNLLWNGYDVVVSNTFTRYWEMVPYLRMAEKHGVLVEIIVCRGEFGSVHGIPSEKLEDMRQRWED